MIGTVVLLVIYRIGLSADHRLVPTVINAQSAHLPSGSSSADEVGKRVEALEDLLTKLLRLGVLSGLRGRGPGRLRAVRDHRGHRPPCGGCRVRHQGRRVLDYVMGFLILVEGPFFKGDYVAVGLHPGTEGVVEEVGLRRTVLRDQTGASNAVSNGLIRLSSKITRLFSVAVVDIHVLADKLDLALATMTRVAGELREDAAWADRFSADASTNVWVTGIGMDGASVRLQMQVHTGAQGDVAVSFVGGWWRLWRQRRFRPGDGTHRCRSSASPTPRRRLRSRGSLPHMEQPTTYRVPGAVLTEREHAVPLDHANPTARRSPSSPARWPRPTAWTGRTCVFLQGGPGFEATRPTSPPSGWMKRALADYRVLLLDQRGTGRSTPVGRRSRAPRRGAGRVPDPLPRRLDRARRGADPAGARRRAVERPRPELRRLHLDDLPLDRAGGPARGVHHRRPVADRPARRRRLRRDVPARSSRRTGATSSATRRTGDGSATSSRRLDDEDVRLPIRRPADRAALPPARAAGSATAPASSRSTTSSSCRSARRRSCTTCEAGVRFGRNPIYATLHESSYADGVATRWSASGCCPTRSRERATSRPSTCSPGCGRTTAGCGPHRAAAEHPGGARLAAPVRRGPAARATRSRSPRRSTSTTCTSSASSPRRRPPRSGACGRGSPNEYEHNGLRADGERVLGRLIDLVRGRA